MLYILYEETKTVSMFETRNALFKMFTDLTVALFLEVKKCFCFCFFSGNNQSYFRSKNPCSCKMASEI